MFCANCGKENDNTARFCRACGEPIAAPAGAVPGGAAPASAPLAAPAGQFDYPSGGLQYGGMAAGGGFSPPTTYGAAGVRYGGFWARVVAAIIDGILLSIAFGVITGVLGALAGNRAIAPVYGLSFLGGWLYAAYMESSERQATFGKMAMGLTVTDEQGQRISFGKATGRYFAKILSALILYIGFIMVAFSEKKQGLHDKIAGTLVMKNNR